MSRRMGVELASGSEPSCLERDSEPLGKRKALRRDNLWTLELATWIDRHAA